MIPTIDVDAFIARHADGGVVIDVREPQEYRAGHVPGALLASQERLVPVLSVLPRNRIVHVICQSGNRSLPVTRDLVDRGYDAVSVNGGTSAWIAAGRPVVTGPHAA